MEDNHWFDGRHQLHFLQREDYIYLPPTGNRKLEGEPATSIAEKSSPDIAKLGHQSKVPTINETTDGAGATSPKPRNKDLQEVTTIMTRLYLFTPEKTSSHHVNYLSSMQAVARWVNWGLFIVWKTRFWFKIDQNASTSKKHSFYCNSPNL